MPAKIKRQILFVLILLFLPLIAHADEYMTTTLFSNYGGYMGCFLSNNGKAVWSGASPPEYWNTEVFLYDGVTTRRLTNNTMNDHYPKVNSHGQVVWLQHDYLNQGAADLMYFNGTSTKQLTSNTEWEVGQQISDSGVVIWLISVLDTNGEQTSRYKLYRYNETTTGKLSDNAIYEGSFDYSFQYGGRNVQLNDRGQVLWDDAVKGLCLFDGVRTRVLAPSSSVVDYTLSNSGMVVWQEYQQSPEFNRIYFFNGTTSTLITEDPSAWCAHLNDLGTVVWSEIVSGNNSSYEIFLAANGQVARITDNDRYDSCPKINNNNQIAWVQLYEDVNHNSRTDMMLYSNGSESILNSGLANAHPRAFLLNDLGQVVWFDEQSSSNYFFTGSETITLEGRDALNIIYLSDNGRVLWGGFEGDPSTSRTNLYLAAPRNSVPGAGSMSLSPILHLLLGQ